MRLIDSSFVFLVPVAIGNQSRRRILVEFLGQPTAVIVSCSSCMQEDENVSGHGSTFTFHLIRKGKELAVKKVAG